MWRVDSLVALHLIFGFLQLIFLALKKFPEIIATLKALSFFMGMICLVILALLRKSRFLVTPLILSHMVDAIDLDMVGEVLKKNFDLTLPTVSTCFVLVYVVFRIWELCKKEEKEGGGGAVEGEEELNIVDEEQALLEFNAPEFNIFIFVSSPEQESRSGRDMVTEISELEIGGIDIATTMAADTDDGIASSSKGKGVVVQSSSDEEGDQLVRKKRNRRERPESSTRNCEAPSMMQKLDYVKWTYDLATEALFSNLRSW